MAATMQKGPATGAGNPIVLKSEIPDGMNMRDAARLNPEGKAGNSVLVPQRLTPNQAEALRKDPNTLDVAAVKSDKAASAIGGMVAKARALLAPADRVETTSPIVPIARAVPKVKFTPPVAPITKAKLNTNPPPTAAPRFLDVQDLARDVVRLAESFEKRSVGGREVLSPKMSAANTEMLKDKYDGLPKDKATLDALAEAIVREVNILKAAGKFNKVVVEVGEVKDDLSKPAKDELSRMDVYAMARPSRNDSGARGPDGGASSNRGRGGANDGSGDGGNGNDGGMALGPSEEPERRRRPGSRALSALDVHGQRGIEIAQVDISSVPRGAAIKASLKVAGMTLALGALAVAGSAPLWGVAVLGGALLYYGLSAYLGVQRAKYHASIDGLRKEAASLTSDRSQAKEAKKLLELALENLHKYAKNGDRYLYRSLLVRDPQTSFERDARQFHGIIAELDRFLGGEGSGMSEEARNILWGNISAALGRQPDISSSLTRRKHWIISWIPVMDLLPRGEEK